MNVGILGGMSIVNKWQTTDYEIAVSSMANRLPIGDSNMSDVGA
jgi:hypothetical protein